MSDLAKQIINLITDLVAEANSDPATITRYREPLVGFASAHDPLFAEMKQIVGPHYLHPTELLAEAESVAAFFLPFDKELIRISRRAKTVAREWAVAYIETNKLLRSISAEIGTMLASNGITSATQQPTHVFNKEDLSAAWSHKSTAYIAGLGAFGYHQMLITRSGCAGRFGSVVLSAPLPPTPRPTAEYCRYLRDGRCFYCVKHCPSGALTAQGLDKHLCYAHLLEIDRQFSDLELCDVCGRCALGPCSMEPC